MLIKNKAIEIEYVNIYSLINKKVGIPIFQRFYDWKEDQVKQLLEDIKNSFNSKKQLYLLDFIYYLEDDKIMLADGQQRLVTINLLIKAVNDVIKENNLSNKPLPLFDISYDIIANDLKYKNSFNNYVSAPFKKVYLYLLEFVCENIKDINKIIDVIKNKIFIYIKKCANADDAFLVFQQINTGGKPLTKDEIIKTALDQYQEVYDILIDTSKIKAIRQDLISYYKFTVNDLNANFDNIAIMSFLKEYVTKDKDSFKEFSDAVSKLTTLNNNPIFHVIKYINRPSLFDVLNIMAMKEIKLDTNRDYLEHVMFPLCLASITLSLNGGNPVLFKYMTNEIITMIKNNEKAKKISLYIASYINENAGAFKISLADFTTSLGDVTNCTFNIKKALLILDVIHKNTSGMVNIEKINLEHIYPINAVVEWATNGWPTSYEERKKIVNNIGNYLLLCEAVNKKIQNKYIIDKIPEYNKIIPKDLILQTEINKVNFKLFEKNKIDYITARQKHIAKSIKDTFPFGKVLINK